MKTVASIMVLAVGLFVGAQSALAVDLGLNITVPDQNFSGPLGWAGMQEDNEVEPNCVTGQVWDLEGFYMEGNTLSMVGGYNFSQGRDGFTTGDIFIDNTGDVKYGKYGAAGTTVPTTIQNSDGYKTIGNSLGYDYVLTLDFRTSTYDVLALTPNSQLKTSYYKQNLSSNPWKYVSGGTTLFEDLTFSYITGLTSAQIGNGLKGDAVSDLHNYLTGLDLSFLGNSNFTAHYTMGCGNDNLIGQGTTVVPEPATMVLLGTSLLGLAVRRKKNA